jgi:hypothetical protein
MESDLNGNQVAQTNRVLSSGDISRMRTSTLSECRNLMNTASPSGRNDTRLDWSSPAKNVGIAVTDSLPTLGGKRGRTDRALRIVFGQFAPELTHRKVGVFKNVIAIDPRPPERPTPTLELDLSCAAPIVLLGQPSTLPPP